MSGGVGPSGDIKLPKGEDPVVKKAATVPTHRLVSFRQLNALVVIIVLATSGTVSLEDSIFVVFTFLYMFFLSKVAFPPVPHRDTTTICMRSPILCVYVWLGVLLGMLLPIIYIFGGIFQGDKEGIKAAAPHAFLLASEFFMEGIAASFSLPIRVLVPLLYGARRLFTLSEWVRHEIYKVEEEHGSTSRLHLGRALAVANLLYWFFNMFGFLLPCHLPWSFKRYYGKGND